MGGGEVEDAQLGDDPPGPDEGEAGPVRGPPWVRVDPGAAPELHRRARRDIDDVQAASLALVEGDRQPRPVGRPGVVDRTAAGEDADRGRRRIGHQHEVVLVGARSTWAPAQQDRAPVRRERPDATPRPSPRAAGSGPRSNRAPGTERASTYWNPDGPLPVRRQGKVAGRTCTGSCRPAGRKPGSDWVVPRARPSTSSVTRELGSARPATSTLVRPERERVRGVRGLEDDAAGGHRLHVHRRVGGRGLAGSRAPPRPRRSRRSDTSRSGDPGPPNAGAADVADPRPVAQRDVARHVGLGARVPGQVHVADDRRRHEARRRAGGIDVPDRGLDRARFALGPVAVDRRDRVGVAAIGDSLVVEGQDAGRTTSSLSIATSASPPGDSSSTRIAVVRKGEGSRCSAVTRVLPRTRATLRSRSCQRTRSV